MKVRVPLLLALAVLLVWANSLGAPFTYDDKVEVVHPAVRDLGHPERWIAYSPGRSVLLTTYAVNWALGGLDPRGYHALSVLIHALNAALAWRVASRVLSPGRATFAAAAWALHPMATGGATYLSGRSEALVATFTLVALAAWIDDARTAAPRARAVAYGATLLALLTKESAVVLPLVLLAAEWALVAGGRWRLVEWPRYRPFAVLAGLLVAGRLALAGWPTPEVPRPPVDHVVSQAAAWALYLQLWLVPVGQSILHGLPGVATPGGAVAALGWAAGLGWAVRTRGLTAFAALLWALPLAISSAFVLREPMAEHRAYLAGLGLWLGLASRLPDRREWLLLPLLLAGATVWRNHQWRDEVTLWRGATDRWPASASAWYGYGLALELQDRLREAEGAFARSHAIDGRVEALDELGVCRARLGDTVGAREAWQAALRQDPGHCVALNNLASLALDAGDRAAAAGGYEGTLRACPDDALAHHQLGQLYAGSGDAGRAIFHLQAYLRAEPDGAFAAGTRARLDALGAAPE